MIGWKSGWQIEWKSLWGKALWLRLLSLSGTPLFVSCQPDQAQNPIETDLREAFRLAEARKDILIPLDRMENPRPERWMVNGKEIRFHWDGQ